MAKDKAQDQKEQIKLQAEADLEFFIRLVHPQRVLGSVHLELIQWWTKQDAKSHQLVLLPRDHQKSAMVAYRVAWEITRNPCIRVLYISSTSNLAVKQIRFIKDILTNKVYRRYWPEMVHDDEGKREKWTEIEVIVDHPLRKSEVVRDPTIYAAGLTTNVVGMHCDIAVLDDVVVDDTAYTEEGRERVKRQYGFLSSIEGADGVEWVVGTRYHPKDLYNDLLTMEVELFDDDGEELEPYSLYEVFEKTLEDSSFRDGTGQFLWPRQTRYDGKQFGFDKNIRARKYAQYLNKTQFFAQYYNDPNEIEGSGISRDKFQYYNPVLLKRTMGKWYYGNKRLNVFAAVDFAFSLSQKADSTAIVVVGVDCDRNYYVMDIDRFKSQDISEYFAHILSLHQKWDFRNIRAETSVAQKVIVEDLKNNYIRKHGLSLVVEDSRPTAKEGKKSERISAVLQAKYANRQIFHYVGGYCQTLEEELVLENPPHDDLKDALAMCIESCKYIPSANLGSGLTSRPQVNPVLIHSKFGGIG